VAAFTDSVGAAGVGGGFDLFVGDFFALGSRTGFCGLGIRLRYLGHSVPSRSYWTVSVARSTCAYTKAIAPTNKAIRPVRIFRLRDTRRSPCRKVSKCTSELVCSPAVAHSTKSSPRRKPGCAI